MLPCEQDKSVSRQHGKDNNTARASLEEFPFDSPSLLSSPMAKFCANGPCIAVAVLFSQSFFYSHVCSTLFQGRAATHRPVRPEVGERVADRLGKERSGEVLQRVVLCEGASPVSTNVFLCRLGWGKADAAR